jgi:arsenite-transporting ATPase
MTTNGWGLPAATDAPGAPAFGLANSPVRLLLVAQPARAQAFYAAFAADARFAVQAIATSAADAKAKLALDPEAVLVDVVAFAGPGEFNDVFAAYRGAVWVLLPLGLAPNVADSLRQAPCVIQATEGEPNLAVLAGEFAVAAQTRRPSQRLASDSFTPLRGSTAMIGWRAIAVWSPQGGVGKSTLALALALEATQRRLPTLLVGLGAPDGMPLILEGVSPDPNILNWYANPTVDGLKSAVQVPKRTGQPILVGFRDPVSVGSFDGHTGSTSLTNLAYTAAQAGYGILVLDVSTQELAPAALSAANTLVLVGRADLPGIRSVLEGVHLVKDVMAGQHAIPDGAIHLVLNRVRSTTLRPDEVVAYGKRERRDFPPLAAYVADDPNVETALNRMEPAYYGSESLRGAVKTLGDLLFPAALAAQPTAAAPAKIVKVGPLRVRM